MLKTEPTPFARGRSSKVLLVLTGLLAGLQASSTQPIEKARAKPVERAPERMTSPDQVPKGLGKSDWASIREAYEAGRHAFQAVEGEPGVWRARNPGQAWTTEFDRRGFVARPQSGGWEWGLDLRSYGFGEEAIAVRGTAEVRAEGQRLTYAWDDTVEEWFVNDQRGLEHGFTVSEQPAVVEPASRGSELLNFTLAVRGGLRPEISADGQGVAFRDAAGATVLNYGGLKVWDADGKTLPARFARVESTGETLRLSVDEGEARYPITIDPLAQQAYLKASNTGTTDYFGASVSVSGDTVVVGAYGEDSSTTGVNTTPNTTGRLAGAAYVFVRHGATWSQQAYLKASNTGVDDLFGYSVAVSGDTVVVGAQWEDSSAPGVNSTPNESAFNAGAAYVFVRSGTTWSQQAYLKAGNTGAGDVFGFSVSVSGDTVVVGALGEGSSTTGVNTTPNESAHGSGAAYVFVRRGSAWSQEAYLKASNTGAGDGLGFSVSVSGDTLVAGAREEDSSTTGVNNQPNESAGNSGAAYVFVRSGATWTQQAYLKASNTAANDTFGYSASISGDTVVVGAVGQAGSSGAAYVFVRSGEAWTQQAYLKAGNPGGFDVFGHSVAVFGDSIVVGAREEDSSTTGVNSTPNEAASGAGAAYLFVRSGALWAQQAYLKANNTGADDNFGHSVSISGETVVVGAPGEDSGTTGVNSTPNESANHAGAAYAFSPAERLPTVTTPTVESIKASTATLGGTVTPFIAPAITERGLLFSPTATNPDPLLGGIGVVRWPVSGTVGSFSTEVTGLSPATAYSFKAYAINGLGIGYTPVAAFTTFAAGPGVPPDAPIIGAATPGNGLVLVAFTAPANNGGTTITRYTATCGSRSTSGTFSPITVTELPNGIAVTCTVVATNAVGNSPASAASNSVTPTNFTGGAIPRLVNISTRGHVATGDNILIGGFIIGGSQPKRVIVRGRGPSLAPLGVPGTLSDPSIRLFSGSTPIGFNDDWQATDALEIFATGQAPTDHREAAILTTVTPGVAYTVHLSGVSATSGIALVEVFELDQPQVPLLNISTRGLVLTGDQVLIGGFIIQGGAAQQVLIVAKGPSLGAAPFNVPGSLPDPTLELYQAGLKEPIETNDNWVESANMAAIHASGNAPTNPLEAAIIRTLAPGAYTAIVKGVGAFQGIGLVEVYKK